uniref:Uncharacterized protein n=1 Tax=Anguilla anguilla TaxID=7936 RepID=A0A0E9VHR2_ANGAN
MRHLPPVLCVLVYVLP